MSAPPADLPISDAEYAKGRDYLQGQRGVVYYLPTAEICDQTLTILGSRLRALRGSDKETEISDLCADIDAILLRRMFWAWLEN